MYSFYCYFLYLFENVWGFIQEQQGPRQQKPPEVHNRSYIQAGVLCYCLIV